VATWAVHLMTSFKLNRGGSLVLGVEYALEF
jgi:hypothetical protein